MYKSQHMILMLRERQKQETRERDWETHFLMREHVGAELALLALDDLDVRLHAVFCEVLREQVAYVGI